MKNARVPKSILGEEPMVEDGGAVAALSAALHRVDAIYRTPRHNHNPIELHAVTLLWEDGELYVHDASQAVAQSPWTLASVFDLDENQVHVSSPYVGGGFGSKTLYATKTFTIGRLSPVPPMRRIDGYGRRPVPGDVVFAKGRGEAVGPRRAGKACLALATWEIRRTW